ncbi:ABC transporter substrate-binding protein [Clostridium disporicum]|uniref:ABC transporter substrate-binding protein n=1 Tax=Clostridium disporicum TaxID=84024 RepID=UPI00321982DF
MKKSKIIKKLIVMGLLVGTIASIGCGNVTTKTEENNGNDEIVINHELGTTILEETPENIAVLELSFLDSLYNLDIDPIAIADDNDPKKVSDVTEGELVDYTSVGKRMEPSLEELSMMDLDLIIADVSRHSEIYEDLNKIAPTIVLKSIDSSYEEYKENFETIAKAVGKENEATEKVEEIKEFLSEVSKLSQEVVKGKTVLTVSPKNDAYTAHTSSSFVGQVLEKAGFVNAVQSEEFEQSLSLEQLVEINPDIIIYMRDDKDKTIYSQWKDTELYNSLDAVKNDQVFTTVARGPWTQYRGFISVKTIVNEVEGWLLNK